MTPKDIIVSGIQPTGQAHIGNWAGSFRNWQKLQEQFPGQCFFFLVDYHAMTVDYDPQERREQVIDMAATLMALGIGADPKTSTLFLQSGVPEVTELAWIFSTVTPMAEMERMTQYKDKAARNDKNVNVGLFTYPILQAADILIYGGNAVPVGQDQVQHVETTRVIARSFNKRFGDTFPEPKELLTETPKVMSLTEPTQKMSKSHGVKSYIALDDEPDVILKKLKGVPTEPSGEVTPELLKTEAYAGVKLMFDLLSLVGAEETRKAFMAKGSLKYGEVKEAVAEAVATYFADFRSKKQELMKDPARIQAVLADGAEKARAIAQRTMEDVRRKTGLR